GRTGPAAHGRELGVVPAVLRRLPGRYGPAGLLVLLRRGARRREARDAAHRLLRRRRPHAERPGPRRPPEAGPGRGRGRGRGRAEEPGAAPACAPTRRDRTASPRGRHARSRGARLAIGRSGRHGAPGRDGTRRVVRGGPRRHGSEPGARRPGPRRDPPGERPDRGRLPQQVARVAGLRPEEGTVMTTTRTRRATGLLAAIVLMVGGFAATAPAHAATRAVDDGALAWGFKESFRSYVARQIAALPPI